MSAFASGVFRIGLRARVAAAVFALACLSFLIHAPSLSQGFINFDDRRVLVDHPELYNQARFADSLRAILFERFPREEPLLVRDISWAIDSRIFGFRNPAGFHFTNVALHAGVVVLMFLLLGLSSRRWGAAAGAAAFFLLLAVHVEPVSWVMGRKDILVTLFMLLALLSECRMLDADTLRRRAAWYCAGLGCLVLALFSKINAVVFPGVMFLYLLCFPYLRGQRPPAEPPPWRQVLTRLVPLMIPHVLLSLAAYRWYRGVLDAYGIMDRGYHVSLLQHAWNLLKIDPMVVAKYVRLLFAPARLSLFYAWPGLTPPLPWPLVLASMAIAGALSFLACHLWRHHRDLAFYYFSFFILMIPYLNIAYFGIWIANRYVYTASFCVVALAFEVLRRHRRPRPVGILLVALLLVSGAANLWAKLQYQARWKDSETLWSYEIGLPGTQVYAFENLASLYYGQIAAAGPAKRAKLIERVKRVVQEGEARFWRNRQAPPPRGLYFLYFLHAIVAQARGDPPEVQQRALEASEALNPDFHATLFELSVFHYRQALRTEGPEREAAARRSLEYFRRYAAHSLRDRETTAKIRDMREAYAVDFPFLAAEAAGLR